MEPDRSKPRLLIINPYRGDTQEVGLFSLTELYGLVSGLERLAVYLNRKEVEVDVINVSLFKNPTKARRWRWLYKNNKKVSSFRFSIFDFPQKIWEYDAIGFSLSDPELRDSASFEKLLADLRLKTNAPFFVGGPAVWDNGVTVLERYPALDMLVYQYGERPLKLVLRKIFSENWCHPLKMENVSSLFNQGLIKKIPKGTFFKFKAPYPIQTPAGLEIVQEKITSKGGDDWVLRRGTKEDLGFEKVPPKAYRYKSKHETRISLASSFGCPYGGCSFCAWGAHTEFQNVSMEDVIYNIEQAHPRWIDFDDASFLSDYPRRENLPLEKMNRVLYSYRFFKEIIARKGKTIHPNLKMTMCARTDGFPPNSIVPTNKIDEFMRLMTQAGITQVDLGFESGSHYVLTKEFTKGVTVDSSLNAIDLCAKYGIKTTGCFILAPMNARAIDLIDNLRLIAYLLQKNPENGADVNNFIIKHKGIYTRIYQRCSMIARFNDFDADLCIPSNEYVQRVMHYATGRMPPEHMYTHNRDPLHAAMVRSMQPKLALDRHRMTYRDLPDIRKWWGFVLKRCLLNTSDMLKVNLNEGAKAEIAAALNKPATPKMEKFLDYLSNYGIECCRAIKNFEELCSSNASLRGKAEKEYKEYVKEMCKKSEFRK